MGSVFGPIRFLRPVCRLCWTYSLYMHIFSCIFLSNYWWQKSDIWSQALYRYPISWEAFFDLSDFYFLFAKERGYHKWALAHSSSCLLWFFFLVIPPLIERGLYCNHLVRPSVHTFVKDVSASTLRNDFIFDIGLWHGDLYRVSPFQVYRTSTSCLPFDLQMNEWGYS